MFSLCFYFPVCVWKKKKYVWIQNKSHFCLLISDNRSTSRGQNYFFECDTRPAPIPFIQYVCEHFYERIYASNQKLFRVMCHMFQTFVIGITICPNYLWSSEYESMCTITFNQFPSSTYTCYVSATHQNQIPEKLRKIIFSHCLLATVKIDLILDLFIINRFIFFNTLRPKTIGSIKIDHISSLYILLCVIFGNAHNVVSSFNLQRSLKFLNIRFYRVFSFSIETLMLREKTLTTWKRVAKIYATGPHRNAKTNSI